MNSQPQQGLKSLNSKISQSINGMQDLRDCLQQVRDHYDTMRQLNQSQITDMKDQINQLKEIIGDHETRLATIES